MATQNIIGVQVQKLREIQGMTQDQLAGACQRLGWDVSRVTIAKIETGVRAVNDGEVVVLASVLKSTPGEILDKVKVPKAMKVVRQGKTETER